MESLEEKIEYLAIGKYHRKTFQINNKTSIVIVSTIIVLSKSTFYINIVVLYRVEQSARWCTLLISVPRPCLPF
jgi:hypothetical protein